MQRALRDFKGLPHRLQLVGEVSGVRFYDDSIATTPGSAIAALWALEQPKVMILGGSDKGADFTELAGEVKRQGDGVRKVVLVGDMAAKIQTALHVAGVNDKDLLLPGKPSMDEIVRRAMGYVQEGDAVVLSPACASYDMFASYQDRGNQFIAAMKRLPAHE